MTEFEKKIIEQNEQILKNQETLIEMLVISPNAVWGDSSFYVFLKPYYKHHNMPLEPLEKRLKELEELHEKQESELKAHPVYKPLGEEY